VSKSPFFYHRNLPHWHPQGRAIFLTWRLAGSLPPTVINQLRITRDRLKLARTESKTAEQRVLEYKKLFAKVDAILDSAKSGHVWLKESPIAEIVQEALRERYKSLYALWSYVIMANHVHVLLTPKPPATIATITKRLKGFTAREANKFLKRTGGPFWQDESFDHWARDRAEFLRIIKYIENNPVKAGLAVAPENWQWSSAAERKRRGFTDITPLT
jgi:REP element-mobilizing transposase RayT